MKRILILVIVLLSAQLIYGQQYFSYTKAINGIWGEWTGSGLQIKGKFSDLLAYRTGDHPSNFIFRLETSGMEKLFDQSKEAKAIRKKHLKENQWYELSGEITFYGTSDFESFINKFPNIYEGATTSTSNGGKVRVKVSIPPFKDKDGINILNILYNNSGLAISLRQ